MQDSNQSPGRIHRIQDRLLRPFLLDPRSLALFRLLLGLVVAADLLRRWPQAVAFYSSDGVLSAELASRASGMKLLNWLPDSPVAVHAYFAFAAAAVAVLLLGLAPRFAMASLWLFYLWAAGRNPLNLIGADQVLSCMLLWGAIAPRAAAARPFGGWPAKWGKGEPQLAFSLATVGLVLQICVIYLATAVAKSGNDWRDGSALYYALHLDQSVFPLAWRLREWSPGILRSLTWGTLSLEYAAPVLILCPWLQPLLRRLALIGLIGLHLGVAATMDAGLFSYVMLASLSLLLAPNDWRVFRGWARWILPRPARVDASRESSEIALSLGEQLRSCAACQVLAAGLIVVMFVDAWTQTVAADHPAWSLPGGRYIATAAQTLRFSQRWEMFAPNPPRNDGWWIAKAESSLGDVEDQPNVDLISGSPLDWSKPKYGRLAKSDLQANSLWRTYLKQCLSLPRTPGGEVGNADRLAAIAELRVQLAEYLARFRSMTLDDVDHVAAVQFFFIQEFTLPLGSPEPFATQRYGLGSVDLAAHSYTPSETPAVWTTYFPDGDLREQGAYVDEAKHGPWIEVGDDRTRAEGSYSSGLRDGVWSTFDSGGRRITEATYALGQLDGPWNEWRPSGEKLAQGAFEHGVRTGVWTQWHANGQRRAEGTLRDGIPFGEWRYWHPNGQLAEKGVFFEGRREGQWTNWYDHGGLERRGEYSEGNRVGPWIAWHRNGAKWTEGEYVDGLQEGTWLLYDDTGRLEAKVEYRGGQFVKSEQP